MKPSACACASLAIIVGSNGGAWAQPAEPVDEPAPEVPAEPPLPAPGDEATQPAEPPPAQPEVAPPTPAPPPNYPPYYYPYPYYPYPTRPPPSPPRVLPYEEGVPGPPGYQLRDRSQRGLVIAGSVTLGSTWLLSAVTAGIIAAGNSEEEFVPLFVPLVGPFITLGTSDANTLGSFVLVVDGLAQVMGLGMLVAGVIYPKHQWVLSALQVELTPLVSTDVAGLGAKGSF